MNCTAIVCSPRIKLSRLSTTSEITIGNCSVHDNSLHGRPLQCLSDGITPHITKLADGMGITCYVYHLSDARLNFLSGRFHREY